MTGVMSEEAQGEEEAEEAGGRPRRQQCFRLPSGRWASG